MSVGDISEVLISGALAGIATDLTKKKKYQERKEELDPHDIQEEVNYGEKKAEKKDKPSQKDQSLKQEVSNSLHDSALTDKVAKEIMDFANEEDSSKTSQDESLGLRNFKAQINSQRSNPNSKGTYRGIGASCRRNKEGHYEIKDVFSPEISRFKVDGQSSSLEKGQIITHVKIDGEFVDLSTISRSEAASAFHSDGVVEFKADGKEYSCDNTNNKTALFTPNTASLRDSNASKFCALSQSLEKSPDLAKELARDVIAAIPNSSPEQAKADKCKGGISYSR